MKTADREIIQLLKNMPAGGGGGVTSISVATANGISGTSSGGATPALTLALGAITPSSVAIGGGSAITSSGAGGAMGSNAFTSGGLVSDGQQIFDGGHVLAADFGARKLYAANGTTVALEFDDTYPAALFYGGAGSGGLTISANDTMAYGNAQFFPDGSAKLPDGVLDSGNNSSISFQNRQLIANDGSTTALDWSDPTKLVSALPIQANGSLLTNLPGGHAIAAYAAGTAYTLTNSDALVAFGTTNPTLVIDQAGTYLILGRAYLKYNGATYATTQTATVHLRRTNNTAADVANATTTATMRVITTITDSVGIMSLPGVIYTTANTDDSISVYGSLSATPAAGSVQCTEASIIAIRLF